MELTPPKFKLARMATHQAEHAKQQAPKYPVRMVGRKVQGPQHGTWNGRVGGRDGEAGLPPGRSQPNFTVLLSPPYIGTSEGPSTGPYPDRQLPPCGMGNREICLLRPPQARPSDPIQLEPYVGHHEHGSCAGSSRACPQSPAHTSPREWDLSLGPVCFVHGCNRIGYSGQDESPYLC